MAPWSAGGSQTPASSRRRWTIAAVAASSVISSGTARTRTPGTVGAASPLSHQPAVEHAAARPRAP